MRLRQHGQHPLYLVARQHHGDALRPPCTDDVAEPRQINLQHIAVEEEKGRQRLSLRGRGDVSFRRQIREKGAHLGSAHGQRVPLAVKEDEAANPRDILLFRAIAVVPHADRFPDAIEETLRLLIRHAAKQPGMLCRSEVGYAPSKQQDAWSARMLSGGLPEFLCEVRRPN